MTWSYTDTALATSTKDQVRFLVGDTDTTDQQLQDEEINFVLTQEAGVYRAASQCAKNIAAKYARQVTRSFGGRSDQLSQLVDHYRQLAKDLWAKGTLKRMTFYAGGQSQSEKDSQAQNTDMVEPFFSRNAGRNPATQSEEDFADYPNMPSDWAGN